MPIGAAARPAGFHLSTEQVRQLDLTPKTITAFLVGLNTKTAIFRVQRKINEFTAEPLLAILPGLTLQQLWDLMGLAENALLVVSGLVVLVSFTVMLVALLTSLNERRREMAILRAVGARPSQIFSLVLGESVTLALAGAVCGLLLLQGALWLAGPVLEARLGLTIALGHPPAMNSCCWSLCWVVVSWPALSRLARLPLFGRRRHDHSDVNDHVSFRLLATSTCWAARRL